MPTSRLTQSPRGSANGVFTTKRREAGTSLVEILVVIVIFLIGILAVVQVFPRGFRLLLTSRNNSVATALGRDEVERMKSNPAGLMDEVLPVQYVAGVPTVNNTVNPLSLSPLGDAISQAGLLTRGGSDATDWMLASGANVARRIIGEGARVPAPRMVNTLYGGLMVLEHGPVAQNSPLVAYANDLSRNSGPPVESTPDGVYVPADSSASIHACNPDGTGNLGAVGGTAVKTPSNVGPYEYFVANAATTDAALLLPTTVFDRTYRIRLSGFAGTGAGGYPRTDWVSLSLFVPGKVASDAHPLVAVSIAGLLSASGVIPGKTFVGLEYDTVRVAPQYIPVPAPSSALELTLWNNDAFRMVVNDAVLGCIVFSPAGREGAVNRPGGVSEPLVAKVDYDVYDWRILREDFRSVGSPSFNLALQSLKVGAEAGPDGRTSSGLFNVSQWAAAGGVDPSTSASDPAQYSRDNVAIIDLTTGFQVQEYKTDDKDGNGRLLVDKPFNDSNALISVDKSRGVVTLLDADPNTPGTQVRLIPPKGGAIGVSVENRTFRVLYKAKNEWSVQIVKGASQYSEVGSFTVASGNFLVGGGAAGGDPTKIYFPASDIGRKVTIDRILYLTGSTVRTLEGQDFVIEKPGVTETTSLGHVDLAKTVDPNATGFVRNLAGGVVDPVRGVKGASVLVRVLWNPDAFALTATPAENMTRVDQWGRSWRRSTTETYLRAEESR